MSRSASISAGPSGRGLAGTARRSLLGALSDERLARLVARDGQAPFAELYKRHHQALYRYCRSIVRDEHDAEDALQNAMVAAFAALRKSERDIALRPWLFRIAHNEAVSVLRRRQPQEIAADELALAAPANISEPALVVEQRERLAMLLSDLGGLTIRQRSILVMRELSGLSIEEIAAACTSSQGAVKQTLFEAREALRENERGRSMECEQVRRTIFEEDRRALRARRLRSHLRACAGCREVAEATATRRQDLRLLVSPLPPAAATALLSRLFDTAASVHAGAASGASTGAAGGGAQAATAGSCGTGAATSGVGAISAGGAAPGVAAHAGGAIAVKALTAAVIVAFGGAGVAGVASSGSSSSGTRDGRVTSGQGSHHLTARERPESRASASFRQPPSGGGQQERRASRDAKTSTRLPGPRAAIVSQTSDRGRGEAHAPEVAAQAGEPEKVAERGRSSEAHESPGHSAGAPGKAKAQPNASDGKSHGRRQRSKHAVTHGEATRKSKSAARRSNGRTKPHASSKSTKHGSSKATGHVSHEAPAPGKSKLTKEAGAGDEGAKGEEKQPAVSGAPVEGEAKAVEAPPSERGKDAHQPQPAG